jgi:sulfur carrier protein
VPCAEIYPLNLMQLVLPKGKVRQYLLSFSSPVTGHPYRLKKTEKMEITVNNQPFKLDAPSSVSRLLSAVLQIPATGIAIAVNQAIVSKSDWQEYVLQPGDQVVLIKATQGG